MYNQCCGFKSVSSPQRWTPVSATITITIPVLTTLAGVDSSGYYEDSCGFLL